MAWCRPNSPARRRRLPCEHFLQRIHSNPERLGRNASHLLRQRIERHQPDVATAYQSSPASSPLPNPPITSASLSWVAILSAAAAQPARIALAGLRSTSASRSMVISACPSSPICASSGFGITIPRELPMRRMAIWVRFIVITMSHHTPYLSIPLQSVTHSRRYPSTAPFRAARTSAPLYRELICCQQCLAPRLESRWPVRAGRQQCLRSNRQTCLRHS
jgi:hypothetical protein